MHIRRVVCVSACLVKRGESCYLPPGDAFRFSPPPGKETLRLVACPKALPWAHADELWEIQEGHMLSVLTHAES